MLKRKILTHFESKQDPKKEVHMMGQRIEKIEISTNNLIIHFAKVCGEKIMPALLAGVDAYPLQNIRNETEIENV